MPRPFISHVTSIMKRQATPGAKGRTPLLTIASLASRLKQFFQRLNPFSSRVPAGLLCLRDASRLLENDFLPVESGYGLTRDNMAHVAASTYMPGVTAEMIDWWFGFVHTTEHYKWWHPRDHVFSDWEGPRNNDSTYIGGHHMVEEYVGPVLCQLKISFLDPGTYFGPDWQEKFKECGYGTAICGRVGEWNRGTGKVLYNGHLIHLVKNEPDGVRMRSRFWLGDIEGLDRPIGNMVPEKMTAGLMKHASEEMAILASKLPDLYRTYAKDSRKDSGI